MTVTYTAGEGNKKSVVHTNQDIAQAAAHAASQAALKTDVGTDIGVENQASYTNRSGWKRATIAVSSIATGGLGYLAWLGQKKARKWDSSATYNTRTKKVKITLNEQITPDLVGFSALYKAGLGGMWESKADGKAEETLASIDPTKLLMQFNLNAALKSADGNDLNEQQKKELLAAQMWEFFRRHRMSTYDLKKKNEKDDPIAINAVVVSTASKANPLQDVSQRLDLTNGERYLVTSKATNKAYHLQKTDASFKIRPDYRLGMIFGNKERIFAEQIDMAIDFGGRQKADGSPISITLKPSSVEIALYQVARIQAYKAMMEEMGITPAITEPKILTSRGMQKSLAQLKEHNRYQELVEKFKVEIRAQGEERVKAFTEAEKTAIHANPIPGKSSKEQHEEKNESERVAIGSAISETALLAERKAHEQALAKLPAAADKKKHTDRITEINTALLGRSTAQRSEIEAELKKLSSGRPDTAPAAPEPVTPKSPAATSALPGASITRTEPDDEITVDHQKLIKAANDAWTAWDNDKTSIQKEFEFWTATHAEAAHAKKNNLKSLAWTNLATNSFFTPEELQAKVDEAQKKLDTAAKEQEKEKLALVALNDVKTEMSKVEAAAKELLSDPSDAKTKALNQVIENANKKITENNDKYKDAGVNYGLVPKQLSGGGFLDTKNAVTEAFNKRKLELEKKKDDNGSAPEERKALNTLAELIGAAKPYPDNGHIVVVDPHAAAKNQAFVDLGKEMEKVKDAALEAKAAPTDATKIAGLIQTIEQANAKIFSNNDLNKGITWTPVCTLLGGKSFPDTKNAITEAFNLRKAELDQKKDDSGSNPAERKALNTLAELSGVASKPYPDNGRIAAAAKPVVPATQQIRNLLDEPREPVATTSTVHPDGMPSALASSGLLPTTTFRLSALAASAVQQPQKPTSPSSTQNNTTTASINFGQPKQP